MRNEIYNYEQIMLGKSKIYSSKLFYKNLKEKGSLKSNNDVALSIIKYALEDLLEWTPEDIYYRLNQNVMEKLKLNSLLNYINYPIELDKKKDYFYIACLLYPKKFKVDLKKIALFTYKEVVNGTNKKMPKGFFVGEDGKYRAIICLNYILSLKKSFTSIEDYYDFFASRQSNVFIKEMRLKQAQDTHYSTVLDYGHDALDDENKNNFLYTYHKVKNLL